MTNTKIFLVSVGCFFVIFAVIITFVPFLPDELGIGYGDAFLISVLAALPFLVTTPVWVLICGIGFIITSVLARGDQRFLEYKSDIVVAAISYGFLRLRIWAEDLSE